MTRALGKPLYVSAATNRTSHAADISPGSLVCFASQNLLALWDASDATVFKTMRGHQKNITCVKWSGDQILVTGDEAGTLQIRRRDLNEWHLIISHQAHERGKPITALAACDNIIVTGSSDATTKVWKLVERDAAESTLSHVQTLDMKGKYPLDAELSVFPNTSCLMLAVSSTSNNVDIWTGTYDSPFFHSASLSGHEDWVKAVSFRCVQSPPQVILASGSQDGIIRLWKISEITSPHVPVSKDDIFDLFEASLGEFGEAEEGGRQMSTKRHLITMKSISGRLQHFSLTFDALLIGHEAGITSLSWMKSVSSSERLALLSTSVDSSVIIWSPSLPHEKTSNSNDSSPIWINQQRFGDVGGQRFGGFVGGFWSTDRIEVMAWGWNGAWRRWRRLTPPSHSSEIWEEIEAITGHQGAVKSIAWAPNGDYLLSTGVDQTSRIHGPSRYLFGALVQDEFWHELARPQVHGYDMVDANFLNALCFVSIADEKVARVFDAPKNFVMTVNSLGTVEVPTIENSRPFAANIPPLGLSNKAVDLSTNLEIPTTDCLQRCPFEGELTTVTLWPEIEKIFGHGYELISLAVSHSESLLATACKSSTADHAVIRLNDSRSWMPIGQPLAGHNLTVTRMCFSPDDKLLLSVSRDRTWRLFKANTNIDEGYSHIASCKAHERIIWDCAWVKEVSELMFATASRDKTVKLWQGSQAAVDTWKNTATLTFKEAATSLDFTPVLSDGRRRLAIGLENGDILVYSQDTHDTGRSWSLEYTFAESLGHVNSVLRLSWRPSDDLGPVQYLASCSEDGIIRLTAVHMDFN